MNALGAALGRAFEVAEPAVPGPDGGRAWFTAAELAELRLPGLPGDKRSINRRARDENWPHRCAADGSPLARARAGRGGGTEFHLSLLPGPARLELLRRGMIVAPEAAPEAAQPASGWAWFEVQSDKIKAEAERRAAAIDEIELLSDAGLTRTSAIQEVGRRSGVATSTLWNWLDLVNGVARGEWLPALAPRRKGGGKRAEIDEELWRVFRSDYLSPSCPTLTSCYRRTARIAESRGLAMPTEITFKRRLEREVPAAVVLLERKGPEALRRSVPAQRRTVEHLHALELVNIDGHRLDVRVTPPGGGDPIRPMLVAIQDIYSSKVLAWCLDLDENSIQTQIAFGNLFRQYGLPRAVLLDNGRAFASKKISGGARTRFRFKIRDDEPTGVLMALDINPRWALPYRGQSKPIERAFRDMCDAISRHPECRGAYVGNSPVNKPFNYGARAMEWDAFVAHLTAGIAEHNAQTGRTGRHYRRFAGASFDTIFAESYSVAPIRKAGAEHLRRALLTAQARRVNSQTGEIELFGNRYWADGLYEFRGQKMMVRFDPENLHSQIEVFTLDNRFVMSAPVIADSGFDSEAGAKATAKRLGDYRRKVRAARDAQDLQTAEEVAAMQVRLAPITPPEPSIIQPVRHRGQIAAARKPAPVAPVVEQSEINVFRGLSIVRTE